MQLLLFDETATQHNLFFALQPPEIARARSASVAAQMIGHQHLRGRLLSPERLHVSLLSIGCFVGPGPLHIVNDVKKLARAVVMPPFELSFDRVASFGAGALVLTGGESAGDVMRLRHSLKLTLAKAGVKLRSRKSFMPHMTMAYADRMPTLAIEPICWPASEFVLIDSLIGQSKHVLLGRWPLRSASNPGGWEHCPVRSTDEFAMVDAHRAVSEPADIPSLDI